MMIKDRIFAKKRINSGAWKDYKVGILLKMNENILRNSY